MAISEEVFGLRHIDLEWTSNRLLSLVVSFHLTASDVRNAISNFPGRITFPRCSILIVKNLNFFSFSVISASWSKERTICTCIMCSSKVWENRDVVIIQEQFTIWQGILSNPSVLKTLGALCSPEGVLIDQESPWWEAKGCLSFYFVDHDLSVSIFCGLSREYHLIS